MIFSQNRLYVFIMKKISSVKFVSSWSRCVRNFILVILKLIEKIYILSFSCEIALRWMPKDLTDD